MRGEEKKALAGGPSGGITKCILSLDLDLEAAGARRALEMRAPKNVKPMRLKILFLDCRPQVPGQLSEVQFLSQGPAWDISLPPYERIK